MLVRRNAVKDIHTMRATLTEISGVGDSVKSVNANGGHPNESSTRSSSDVCEYVLDGFNKCWVAA